MSEPARNRFALDLEDLERQLRGAGQMPRPGQQVDPLAELTRIVGQDDPLKEIFAEKASGSVAAWPGARQEPSFTRAAPKPAPAPEVRGALDEFEALLRRGEGGRPAQAAQPVPVAPQPVVQPRYEAAPAARFPSFDELGGGNTPRDLDEMRGGYVIPASVPDPDYDYGRQDEVDQAYVPDEDMPDLEPRRSRKGLIVATALVVIGVAGVGAAMALRGSKVTGDGTPPTIAADQSPVKIQPANPGGAEIPNQNKQIYERAGEAPGGKTKVVSSEEQPVDVQQAARTMPSRVVLAGPGAPATPASTGPAAQAPAAADIAAPLTPAEPTLVPVPAVPGLGEPRRVRTVSIRPDGSPAVPSETGANQPSVTAALPPKPPATATPAVTPQPPARLPVAEAPKVQERAIAPAATPPASTTPAAPLRLASAAPSATANAPAAAAPSAPATAGIRAGAGDYIVQLAAPGSEAEARATFAGLQRKYGNVLGAYSPIVRKTELAGGKTVYRLRVGPFSREDATSMCSQLQGAGGQCFVAKN